MAAWGIYYHRSKKNTSVKSVTSTCLSRVCLGAVQTACWFKHRASPETACRFLWWNQMRFREACEEEREERWIIFLPRHPSRGNCYVRFSFRGKNSSEAELWTWQQTMFYGPWCSLFVHLLPLSDYSPVWLTASVCCLLITDCAGLSICFTAGWCFTLLPCHFVPSLSECFAVIRLRDLIVSQDDDRIRLTNHSRVAVQTVWSW